MKYVVLLIDGLGYDYIQHLPFLGQAQVIQNTTPPITAPQWCTIFTGLTPQQHGVVNNESSRRVSTFRFPHPTLFDDYYGEHPRRRMRLISDWSLLRQYIREPHVSFQHTRHIMTRLSHFINPRARQDLTVINFDRLDSLAHEQGWGSPAYQRFVTRLDQRLQAFDEYLQSLRVPYTLVVTADHGGTPSGDHEDEKDPRVRRVPFLVIQNGRRLSSIIQSTTQIRGWLQRQFRSS